MIRREAVEIEVGAYEETGERDEAGDFISSYVSRTVGVYGVAPSSSDEPEDRNRSSVVTAWDIYAPAGTRIGAHDIVRLPDVPGDCQVKGEPAIWEHNPYGTTMGNIGVVLKVEKVDG